MQIDDDTAPTFSETEFPEIEHIGLPKWPQMLVYGAPVSREQALEVIRRTDSFFKGYGGNDTSWDIAAWDIVGRPLSNFDRGIRMDEPWDMSIFHKQHEWEERWGVIRTEYIGNDWISSCYVGGPSGWIQPDGTIFGTKNVGKWPSAEEVAREWKKMADAFPFLDLAVVLMSGEGCEETTTPVVTIRVKDGTVTATPYGDDPFTTFGSSVQEVSGSTPSIEDMASRLMQPTRFREHGLSLAILQAWATENPIDLSDFTIPD